MRRHYNFFSVLCLALTLTISAFAQDTEIRNRNSSSGAKDEGRRISRAVAGQKQKIKGTIVKRDPDGFIMRDLSGNDWSITLTNSTEVRTQE